MKLSIITVTWNNEKEIETLITSVKKGCQHISYEHIIVDNNSSDKTISLLKKQAGITPIFHTENLGFAKANNIGVKKSTGEYVLFLNPDMEILPGSLDTFIAWMDTQPNDVWVASPKLVDSSGSVEQEAIARRFPTVWEQIMLILKIPHVFPRVLDRYHMNGFDPAIEQQVDSVRGACMLMRRELIESIGYAFDERYFIWYEDVDICREAQKRGKKVLYTPCINVIDLIGQSFAQQPSVWRQKQFTKSMVIYAKKWEPWWKWIWITLFRPMGILFVWVQSVLYRLMK